MPNTNQTELNCLLAEQEQFDAIYLNLDLNITKVKFTTEPRKTWRIYAGYKIEREREVNSQQLKLWPERENYISGYVFLVGSNTKQDGQKWQSVYIPADVFSRKDVIADSSNSRSISYIDSNNIKHKFKFVYNKDQFIRFIITD